MKKIINDPNQVVQDMIRGMIAAFPGDLKQILETMGIAVKNAPIANKVGVVSGGGSGHEPAHAGFVGKGLLDAAVAGEVFTSPTPDQLLEAIKAVDGGAGVFLVIKNYTGDVLNFEMAAELAEAEGIQVEQVVVKDRKSTRLNSSHVAISYAVFCLKKKITKEHRRDSSGSHAPMAGNLAHCAVTR